jgi:putative transposase
MKSNRVKHSRLVRAGAVFHKGKLLERPVDITPPESTDSTETEVA